MTKRYGSRGGTSPRTRVRMAREYFGIEGTGLVMHHKDITMKVNDPERYNQWNPDDLEVMTNKEHRALHNHLSFQGEGNPQYGADHHGEKNGNFGKKHPGLNAGEKNPAYGKPGYTRKRVRCVETGVIYESVKEAKEKTGTSQRIYGALKTGYAVNGRHWEYV